MAYTLANDRGMMLTLLKSKISMKRYEILPLPWFSLVTQKVANVAHRALLQVLAWLSIHLPLHQPSAEGRSNPWDSWQIEILNLLGKHEQRHARSTTLEFRKLWHSWLGFDLHSTHLTIRSIVLEALDYVWAPTLKTLLQSGNGFNMCVSTFSFLRLICLWC